MISINKTFSAVIVLFLLVLAACQTAPPTVSPPANQRGLSPSQGHSQFRFAFSPPSLKSVGSLFHLESRGVCLDVYLHRSSLERWALF